MTLNDVKEGTAMVSVALIVDRTSTLYQDSVFIDIPLEHLIKGYSPILDATIGAISIRKYPIRLAELLREES